MPPAEFVDFRPAVDAVGNHPAKMATLLLFAERAGEALGVTLLAKDFMAMQGEEPGWTLTRGGRSTPFSYCRGMDPELLTETTLPAQRGSGNVKAYRVNEQGLATGVPLSGAGLGWELTHENTSASYLLGPMTLSVAGNRTPSVRLGIYEHLLASPGGMSTAQLQRAMGQAAGRCIDIVPNLRDAGIIDVSERYNPAHRNLALSAPNFAHLRQGGPRVHPETHAIYDVANELVQASRIQMTGRDFLDAVIAKYPQYDPAAVWKRIAVANASNKMRFIGLAPFEADKNQVTMLTIAEQYQEPIAALLQTVNKLETDADYRQEMRDQAIDIIRDEKMMAALMAKTQGNSAFTTPLPRSEWQKLLVTHIPSDGISIRGLYKIVRPFGTPVTYVQFRNILIELAGQGFEVRPGEARGKLQHATGQVSLI
jgi:hypothetical protein